MNVYLKPGSQKIIAQIQGHANITKNAVRKAFHDIGKQLQKTANDEILHGSKTGRIYKIRGRRHQASAPGESWANLTGKARRSINFKVSGSDKLYFGASKKYVKFLELGTVNMESRPTLSASIEKNERNIETEKRKIISKNRHE